MRQRLIMREMNKLKVPVDEFYRATEADKFYTFESIRHDLGLNLKHQILFVTSTSQKDGNPAD